MSRMNFPEMEQQLVQHWQQQRIFERSVEERPASTRRQGEAGPLDKQFVFYDGPPFATGLPHYGHIVASTIKDVVPRYATMKGMRVERRWGWDCHGLPIENLIEQELGLKTKQDIEAIGVDKFNDACKASVLRYAKDWQVTIARLGRWVDMTNDYRTMDATYTESIWWAFKTLYDQGLIYQGHKAMHVCPRCETTLSNFEVTLGYKDVSDMSVIWKFAVVDQPNTYLLAWTTTPWSTPGTMGLSVSPHHTYLKAKVGEDQVIFVKDRLDFVMQDIDKYDIVEEIPGTALVGLTYEPIMTSYKTLPDVQTNSQAYHVFPADYVEVTEGTGIVTINGAYGEIDMQAAKDNTLPVLMDVDMNGHYNDMAGAYAGKYVKDIETQLINDMQETGRVWRSSEYLHSYPHCWRCDTPLLNYATSSWFVRVTELKDRMIRHNQTIQWLPPNIKDGRFGKWLEGAKDWAISRDRYWGAPLPIWQAEDGECICVGSIDELAELSGQRPEDLHKQFVDTIVITKNGKDYHRIPQVLDCWFESGSMPFAQEHYPFENKEKFETTFPAQFIAEGLDQTRGWFYTLMVLSTALFDKPAFRNVIVNGLVLAEDGKKMSKRLKNYPEPAKVLDTYGADALRFYLMNSAVVHAEDLRFSEKGVDQVFKRLIMTLWNVYTFYDMFAEGETVSDDPILKEGPRQGNLHIMDQWILAYVSQAVTNVTKAMDAYELQPATRILEQLVQEISTWYLRRSRDRFKGSAEEKLAALATLRYTLLTTAKMLAPFTPFIAEKIYLAMHGPADSVHLDMWPTVNNEYIDQSIIDQMQTLRQTVEQVLAQREAAGIKVRQPLASVTVPGINNFAEELIAVLVEEVNVKQILSGSRLQLDTTISPELAQEGMVRELVRSINALRKKQQLTIHDRVQIQYETDNQLIREVITTHQQKLAASVLATIIEAGTDGTEYDTELRINDAIVKITLRKL